MTPNLYRSTLLQHTLKLFGFLVLIFLAFPGSGWSQNQNISWKNPILIAGSDFGLVFQGCLKTGNQEMLLALTSQESRSKYGDSTILNYYNKMQFAYSIKLIAYKKVDNYFFMTYNANFLATTHIIVMKIVVEKDTARLVLPNNFLEQTYFLLK